LLFNNTDQKEKPQKRRNTLYDDDNLLEDSSTYTPLTERQKTITK